MLKAVAYAMLLGLIAAGAVGLHYVLANEDQPAAAPSRSVAPASAAARPNVLLVVWDTVRADRMSLYGAARSTTPKVDAWAAGARVFDDVVSTAHSTLPSHAALFTGLLAMQHGAHYGHQRLDDRHQTLAELLSAAGYRTFLWSSNPHVSAEMNFAQGFDATAHPWDPERREEALRIVRDKVAPDVGTGMREIVRGGNVNDWAIKASGVLATPALLSWLAKSDADKPFFAFVNLMEAHRQYVPPRRLRERFLDAQQVERSYAMDNSWPTVWSYTFGLHEYSDEDLEVVAGVYDACLAELDEIFDELLTALRAAGHLQNTVVVLTSDHGEHLGEHHMLDHQYTVFEPVLRVPLVLHYPPRVAPGRSAAPVMSFDVFPTLLELAGAPLPQVASRAQSLLRPAARRLRLAEHPVPHRAPISLVRERHPEWDPSPWLSSMCALYDGPHKLLWRGQRPPLVYDLSADAAERHDLAPQEPQLAGRLKRTLERYLSGLRGGESPAEAVPEMSPEQQERLRALGYAQ